MKSTYDHWDIAICGLIVNPEDRLKFDKWIELINEKDLQPPCFSLQEFEINDAIHKVNSQIEVGARLIGYDQEKNI